MSHIVELKTTIRNPNAELLRQAVETVALEKNGRVADHYLDWYNRSHPATLALFVPGLVRGMAVQTGQDGLLGFVGDFYGCEELAKQLQTLIVQNYVVLGAMQKLSQMNYQVLAETVGQENRVVLRGVRYA